MQTATEVINGLEGKIEELNAQLQKAWAKSDKLRAERDDARLKARELGVAVSVTPQPSVDIKQKCINFICQNPYPAWDQLVELVESCFAAAPAQEPPDKAMLEAIAEDGLLVTWDKDFKFNFSQVVRLMAEFVIEHPWAVAAQEQPVENSPQSSLKDFSVAKALTNFSEEPPQPTVFSPRKGKP